MSDSPTVRIDHVHLTADARRLPGSEGLGTRLGEALALALAPHTEGAQGIDVVIDDIRVSLPAGHAPPHDWLRQVAQQVARHIGRTMEGGDE